MPRRGGVTDIEGNRRSEEEPRFPLLLAIEALQLQVTSRTRR